MLAKLQGVVQNYHWGKLSPDSLVAKYSGISETGLPCAELWFGGHNKAPGILESGVPLNRAIGLSAERLLGKRVVSQFGTELPFLVKFLSIDPKYGLSIQLHPDKNQALKLNRAKPELYSDSFGKPEISFALTNSTLLHGLKPKDEIDKILALSKLSFFKAESITEVIQKILSADDEIRIACIPELNDFGAKNFSKSCYEAFLRLKAAHGEADSGILLFALMNYLELKSGEVIYTHPGTLHAYLDGDILEVLANSDNVVRAGLTPKPRDAETLVSILDPYSTHSGIIALNSARLLRQVSVPAKEFKVSFLEKYSGEIALQTGGGPMMVVSLSGMTRIATGNEIGDIHKAVNLNAGEVSFVGADEKIVWASCTKSSLCIVRV